MPTEAQWIKSVRECLQDTLGTSSLYILYRDLKLQRPVIQRAGYKNRICYGPLPFLKKKDGYEILHVFDNELPTGDRWRLGQDHVKEYINWVLKNSFFAPVFDIDSVEELLEKQCWECNIDFPTQMVTTAGKCVRLVKERPEAIDFWSEFKKYMEPHLALWLAVRTIHFNQRKNDKFVIGGNSLQHHPLDNSFEAAQMRTILEWDFDILKQHPSMRETTSFIHCGPAFRPANAARDHVRYRYPKPQTKGWSSVFGSRDKQIETLVHSLKDVESICAEFLEINGLEKYAR